MKSVFFAFAALAALAVAPSLAVAGGGSKNNSTLTVRNQSSDTAVVAVNNTNLSNQFGNFAGTTLDASEIQSLRSQVISQGGRVLDPGASANFSVRSGNQNVSVLLIDSSGNVVQTAGSTSVNVNGGSRTVTITGDASSGVILN